MNTKNILTVLGCSSSLALLLATANPVGANEARVDRAIESQTPTVEEVDSSPTPEADPFAQEAYGDTIGDAAIDRFRCDCGGCRNMVGASFQNDNLNISK
jgi:hypothetical protein